MAEEGCKKETEDVIAIFCKFFDRLINVKFMLSRNHLYHVQFPLDMEDISMFE